MIRTLSVCTGIGAFEVATRDLPFESVAFAEIAPFPSAVLAYRFPDVPNLGDFSRIEPKDVGPINLLVGGTPCQSFSIAGARAGLDDPRGNLTMEFLRLAARTRPRWVLWENVPGVLSIDGGRTFGTFLGTLGELGYGTAYRILDAQFFGVPQRRRRVFVVGYLGGDWRRAATVLLEPESVCRDFAPGKAKREDVAGTLAARAGSGGGCGPETECPVIAATLKSNSGGGGFGSDPSETFIPMPVAVFDPCQITSKTNRSVPKQGQCHTLPSQATAPVMFQLPQDTAGTLQARTMQSANNPEHLAVTLQARTGGFDLETETPIVSVAGVRRLTPSECERLQGFPDGWTLVPHRNKPASDGPRYKGIGNSMAVPVMRWIAERIAVVDGHPSTPKEATHVA